MSGTTRNMPPSGDLDARVDALVDRIDSAANAATRALDEIAAEVDQHAPSSHPDDVMAAVSADIEAAAPGPLAEPPRVVAEPPADAPKVDLAEDPATTANPAPANDSAPIEPAQSSAEPSTPAVAPGELDEALAAVADDLARHDAAPVTTPEPKRQSSAATDEDPDFEAPSAEELTAPIAVKPSAAASTGTSEAAVEAGPEASERPGADVRKLDDELAAKAEQVLAEAQSDLAKDAVAAAPVAAAVAAAAVQAVATASSATQPGPATTPSTHAATTQPAADPEHAPAAKKAQDAAADHASGPKPDAKPAAASPAAPAAPAGPAAAGPQPATMAAATPTPALRTRVSEALARCASVAALPLAPLAAVHAKLSEETRQTIGYCAILTGFVAAGLWIAIPMLKKPVEHEPVTPAAEFYDPSTPAHGVTAPPKPKPKHADDAAAKGDGHGKKADGGGSKGSDKKAAKKADGGH